MTTFAYAMADSATMLRRNLRHLQRYPSMTITIVGMPVIFLLLFVYVFGGTLSAGLAHTATGTNGYIDYVTPGIIVMTAAAGALATAVSVSVDMTDGIATRFRTMAISRIAPLAGHVAGSMIQTLLAMAVVIGVALAMGFRPTAGPLTWLAAIGVLAMVTFALTWLTVALGMVAKSPETASNLPLPLIILPFLGSGFVPTDSMAPGVRWFAQYQPFSPVINTLRDLLLGTPIGANAALASGWCAIIAAGGCLWARRAYDRNVAR